jgi:MFS family permease
MKKTLHLSSEQFETAVAILFTGYILMQVPSNFLLSRLRPSWYLSTCMALWAIISASTGLVQTAPQLYAVRFLLGFLEAPFTVGMLFVISCWYTRPEMGLRSAILLSAPMFGNASSGLIGAGITSALEGVGGLEAWRWLFITGGLATIVVAILAFGTLPDFPSNTRWLSPKERSVAEWRIILDAGQVDEDDQVGWRETLKVVAKDWRVYFFACMYMLMCLAGSTINFFPSIVKTLGFSRIKTLLLTAPPYLIGIVLAIFNSWSSDRTQNCSYHIVWPLAAAIIGFAVSAASTNTEPRYFAMTIMIAAGHGANAILLAWVQKTMIRPRAKRAVALAFVNASGNLSQVCFQFPLRSLTM